MDDLYLFNDASDSASDKTPYAGAVSAPWLASWASSPSPITLTISSRASSGARASSVSSEAREAMARLSVPSLAGAGSTRGGGGGGGTRYLALATLDMWGHRRICNTKSKQSILQL